MGTLSLSGAASTPAISEQPLAAVALVADDGTLQRATALFLDCCGAADAFLTHFESEIEAITAGSTDHSSTRLDRTTLEISAVLDSDGVRHALLTIVRPPDETPGDIAGSVLGEAIDGSPVIVWLKDMDRRYVRVNERYVEELRTPAERVCGKGDDELAPGESIERLRLRNGHDPRREPLEFEYTVESGDDRPAFAVLRFALRDADAKPTAVCGVAAPLPRAHLARAECARLMRLAGWSHGDEQAIRAELIREWELTPADDAAVELAVPVTPADPPPGDGAADQFAAMAAELDAALETSARLDQALAEERRQVLVLREASVLSARRAQDMFRTVTAERSRSAALEESLASAEARAAELESKEAGLEAELERLRALASDAPTPKELEAERAQAHEGKLAAEQAQAELVSTSAALAKERRTVEALRGELRAAEEEVGRARRAASEAVAQAPTHDELEQERRRADRATASLASARARTELAEAEAKSALAQARAELRRTHEEAVASASDLHAEKQAVVSLRAELSELHEELERARDVLSERPDAEQLDRERSRAAQAEAAAEQAEVAAEQAKAASAQAEGAADKAQREASELADRVAQLEQAAVDAAESSGALSAEQQTVKRLRDELSAVRAELKATERAKKKAAAADTAAEAERKPIEALRAELTAARADVEEWKLLASANEALASAGEAAPSRAGEAASAEATEPVPGTPRWNATCQRELSAELASVTDWRTAVKQVVKIVGGAGNWDAAVVWAPEPRRAHMKCIAVWTGDAISSSTFETRTWQHRQKLPGDPNASEVKVLSPLEGADDAVLKAAAAEGLSWSVLVPISDGMQLIGMLQLFSSRAEAASPDVIVSLEAVGLQLAAAGRLLETASTPHWRVGRL